MNMAEGKQVVFFLWMRFVLSINFLLQHKAMCLHRWYPDLHSKLKGKSSSPSQTLRGLGTNILAGLHWCSSPGKMTFVFWLHLWNDLCLPRIRLSQHLPRAPKPRRKGLCLAAPLMPLWCLSLFRQQETWMQNSRGIRIHLQFLFV